MAAWIAGVLDRRDFELRARVPTTVFDESFLISVVRCPRPPHGSRETFWDAHGVEIDVSTS